MPFEIPSLAELQKRARDTIVEAVARGRPVLRRTVEDALGNAVGAVQYLHLERLRVLWRQLWPDTATGLWLDRIAQLWGLARKDRVAASGKIRITGTEGALLPKGSAFESAVGVVYGTVTDVIVAGGEAFVYVQGTTGGEQTNLPLDAELQLVAGLAGIDGAATVVVGDGGEEGLVGGADLEGDDAPAGGLRARVLARIASPPAGGSSRDYVAWALEVPGITRAWCIPHANGPGTIVVLVVDDASEPITPTPVTIAEVRAHLLERAPAIDVPGIAVGSPELVAVDHVIGLSPNTPAAKSAVLVALHDFFRLRPLGQPVHRSQIGGAIDAAPGEEFHQLVTPAAEVEVGAYALPVLGSVTFQDP